MAFSILKVKPGSDDAGLSTADFFLALILLVLVTLPKFLTYAGTEAFSDSDQYIEFVKYFRGVLSDSLVAPYTRRPLIPYLASLLPFSPLDSLKIINLACLASALFFLMQTLNVLKISRAQAWLGIGLFIVSFPVFYYGCIGLVDPGLIACMTAGVFFMLTKRWIGLALLVIVGALVKEQIIVLVPAAIVCVVLSERRAKSVLICVAVLAAFFIGSYIARSIAPNQSQFFWSPSFLILGENLSRLRFWVSCGISLILIPVLVAGTGFRSIGLFGSAHSKIVYPLLTGILSALGILGFSLLAAYPDGRFVWLSYPFLIPLICYGGKMKLHSSSGVASLRSQ